MEGLLHPWGTPPGGADAPPSRMIRKCSPTHGIRASAEVGLGPQCDAVVFVDAPLEQRLARVRARSGWDEGELLRREKSQMPLDTKKALSDYVVTNAADAGAGPSALTDLREQVRRVLSQILTRPNADAEPRPRPL